MDSTFKVSLANNLKGDKQLLISELFKEAEENGFEIKIGDVHL
jgi:hypothetical protein